ncbi:MAG: helix-hairpin-helix domain-containing protein [Microthrixaceae bacterium]
MDDPFDALAATSGARAAGGARAGSWGERWAPLLERLRSGGWDGSPDSHRGLGRLGWSAVATVALLGAGAWWLSAGRAPPVELPRADGAQGTVGQSDGGALAPVADATSTTSPSAAVGAAGGPADGTAGEPAELVVHVAGQVGEPGVYRVPAGGRVADAVTLAGGAGGTADLDRLNLAEPLVDGARVYVPAVGQVEPPATVGQQTGGATQAPQGPAAGTPAGADGSPGDAGTVGALVNLNTADAAALEELPGVGPVTAEAIVAHRSEAGPFTQVEELLEVRGIGDAKLEAMADLVTVG